MTFDYKKYSLENLENWIHDAMSSGEASPQEIYDTIKGVVDENYHLYKKKTAEAYELLALLNGNGEGHISDTISRGNQIHQEIEDILVGIHDDCRIPCDMEALQYTDEEMDAMCVAAEEEKELISKGYFKENGFWMKPKTSCVVGVQVDGLSGDAIIPIPDEVADIVGWDLDDELEWIDNKDGSYTLRKVTK
jgi:hypothetical protein